jgi:hypothetical protein
MPTVDSGLTCGQGQDWSGSGQREWEPAGTDRGRKPAPVSWLPQRLDANAGITRQVP